MKCINCENKRRLIEVIEKSMMIAEKGVLDELMNFVEEYGSIDKDVLRDIVYDVLLKFRGKFRIELKKEIGGLVRNGWY